jgi:hypothetical protein
MESPLMLGARVQQGLTPSNSKSSITWLSRLALEPKVMVKWLNISWWRMLVVVSGRSRGWMGLVLFFFFFSLSWSLVLSLSLFLQDEKNLEV